MQFYDKFYLFWLWTLLPLAIILFYFLRVKQRRLEAFIHQGLLQKIPSDHSHRKETWRIWILLLTFAFAIVALARPQWGEEKKHLQRKGVDIVFCLDTSLSMLAEDVKPNRFEKARLMMSSFIKRLKGDRVGLVTFAGTSFLSCPLTLDDTAFKLFLDAVQVGFNPDPGSALGDAIYTATSAFPNETKKYQVIVLFSDGEDHEPDTLEVVKQVAARGIRIYTIGVGTTKGDVIPLKSEQGKTEGFKKDRQGNVVVTKLKEDRLQEIARLAGGLYYAATGGEKEIDLIYNDISKMGKKQLKEQVIAEREDHFQLFVAFAVALLLLESMLGEQKHRSFA